MSVPRAVGALHRTHLVMAAGSQPPVTLGIEGSGSAQVESRSVCSV